MSEQGRETVVVAHPAELVAAPARRRFLRALGYGGALVLLPSVFAACDDDDDLAGIGGAGGTTGGATAVTLDLSTEAGVMNLVYVQEQIEAAFYNAAVASSAFAGMTADQREVIGDIRAVENIHRAFVAAALGSARVPDLALSTATLQSVTSSAAQILRTAETLESTGLAALNGGGKFLSAPNLLAVGKAASVEGRHLAAIRDLRETLGVTGYPAAGTAFAGDDHVVPSGPAAGLDLKIEAPTAVNRQQASGIPAASITLTGTPPARPGTPDFAPPFPAP